MPEDFYGTESEAEAPAPNVEEDAGEESALVPKSMLGDCKPGDTYKFKVVGIYDDEVELAKVKEEKSDTETKPESTSDSRMESMMEA